MLWTYLWPIITLWSLQAVNGCLPLPAIAIGPRVGLQSIFPTPDVPSLFTSRLNPNLLGAEVTNFNEQGEISEKLSVVIDLRDGSVTAGSIQDPTTPSTFLNDSTGGFSLELNGQAATLSSGNLRYEVTLFSPMDGDISMNFLYFFVSQKFQRAYLFHVAEIDCRVPGVFFSGCEDCSTCVLEQNYVSIVDLQAVTASVRVFEYSPGLILDDPGSFNSLRVVYDDLQFAMLGPTLCGATPFLFFDETTAVEGRFRPSYVSAIVPGSTNNPRQATAYRPSTREVTADSKNNRLPYTIAESMVIQEVRLIDGEVLRTYDVDMEQIRNLAGFDINRFIVPPPDLPTASPVATGPVSTPVSPSPVIFPAQQPVVVPVPTPGFDPPSVPTIFIQNPALPTTPAPTDVPVLTSRPTWAPFPTVPIPFLGSPIVQPTIQGPIPSVPVPTPVTAPLVAPTTTRAPSPTVPIPFLGPPIGQPNIQPPGTAPIPTPIVAPTPSSTRAPFPTVPIPFLPTFPSPPVAAPPTLAPILNIPTIPIAWGPSVATSSIQESLASAASTRYSAHHHLAVALLFAGVATLYFGY